MQIDPKFAFWFGVWTSILLLVGSSPDLLRNAVPEAWIPVMVADAVLLFKINNIILTAFCGFSAKNAGPLVGSRPNGTAAIALVTAAAGVLARAFFACLALGFLVALVSPAGAQTASATTTKPVVRKAPSWFAPAACSSTSCPSAYIGGTLIGLGGNANLIGGGLNNSIFAGGGMIGVTAGYRYWNGSWYFGGEVSGLMQSQNAANVVNFAPGGFVGIVGMKLGGNAAAFFNQGTTTATQAPISIPQQLQSSLMAPYIEFADVIRRNGSELASGAGAEFTIGNGWTFDTAYLYAPAINGMDALNLIKFGFNYNFR